MFKILKNESWFSEKLFELNLKSMESLNFFQKITSKTHIENTPKKKQKKKSVFSENWSNARCTSKYHFFAEISQKFHAFTFTFTFFSSLYNNKWKICSCWSYIFSPKSPKNCTHWTLHSHLHLPFSVLLNGVVVCGVRFGMCVQRWTHSLGDRILHGWHRGYRCDALALSTWIQFVPGGFEAFRCDVWSKVQRHKKAPRRELCTHTHGPACNIRGSTRSPAMAEGGIYMFGKKYFKTWTASVIQTFPSLMKTKSSPSTFGG